jgi:hypothetical protein
LGDAVWAQSVLEGVQVEIGGNWTSGLFLNQNSRRLLCAMETNLGEGAVFRISYYGPRNMFLEITPADQISLGFRETYLTFISDRDPALSLEAFAEENFMVIEMSDDSVVGQILQIIARAHALTVMDGQTWLFEVPVNGSAKAVESLTDCVIALDGFQP